MARLNINSVNPPLFACCPPGPLLREKRSSTWSIQRSDLEKNELYTDQHRERNKAVVDTACAGQPFGTGPLKVGLPGSPTSACNGSVPHEVVVGEEVILADFLCLGRGQWVGEAIHRELANAIRQFPVPEKLPTLVG